MDCLSYFSNSDLIQPQDCFIPDLDMIIPETDTFCLQAQPPQPFQHNEALSPSPLGFNHLDPFYEPFLTLQEIFLSNPTNEVFVESRDFFPTLTNTSFHHNSLFPSPNPSPLDSYITEASNISEFLVPDFSPAFKVGWSGQDDTKKPALSAQSIAARKRRRRITEKTQELGKLIPGSQKHNTAEMFQAAAKYVKFLQAQIQILQLMQTKMQTPQSSKAERETQFLLASPEIQEKLSTEEVCVVPREVVQVLKAEGCILRNPKISRDINNFLP